MLRRHYYYHYYQFSSFSPPLHIWLEFGTLQNMVRSAFFCLHIGLGSRETWVDPSSTFYKRYNTEEVASPLWASVFPACNGENKLYLLGLLSGNVCKVPILMSHMGQAPHAGGKILSTLYIYMLASVNSGYILPSRQQLRLDEIWWYSFSREHLLSSCSCARYVLKGTWKLAHGIFAIIQRDPWHL